MEDELFLAYKEYILKNSKYSPEVYNKAPQSLSTYPTVVMKENSNIDTNQYKTTERQEHVDTCLYRIEIYTKNKYVGKKLIPSKIMLNELKNLTIKFFYDLGFDRTLCEPSEYLDVTVDRLIIMERCLVNSWNNRISY